MKKNSCGIWKKDHYNDHQAATNKNISEYTLPKVH